MKVYKVACLIFILFIACKEESINPDRFKQGTFLLPEGKGYSKTEITRIDSLQIEKYEDRIDTLSIRWHNNFNYTLKMLHPKIAVDKEPIHVKITDIKDDRYTFDAVIGNSNYIQKGTIIKTN